MLYGEGRKAIQKACLMKDADIRKIAHGVLERFFQRASFRKAEVRTELAFDGAPYVQVDAHFERHPQGDVRVQMKAMDAIRVKLMEEGDDRSVSLTIFADDDETCADDDEDDFAASPDSKN